MGMDDSQCSELLKDQKTNNFSLQIEVAGALSLPDAPPKTKLRHHNPWKLLHLRPPRLLLPTR